MDTKQLTELVINGISIAGGLGIAAIAVLVSVPAAMKEKMLKLDIKNRERMAMLDRGVNPEIVFKQNKGVGQDPLLWSLLLAGLGLGVLLGFLLSRVTGWDRNVLTNGLAILCGGIGLIIYSIFRKRPENKIPA
jgi:hypothetical protein